MIGYFEEKEGVKSSIRLNSFLVFWLLVLIDTYIFKFSYYATRAYDQLFVVFTISINLIFLIAVFYPKYLQKILEMGGAKLKEFKDNLAPVKASDIK